MPQGVQHACARLSEHLLRILKENRGGGGWLGGYSGRRGLVVLLKEIKKEEISIAFSLPEVRHVELSYLLIQFITVVLKGQPRMGPHYARH